MKTRFHDLFLVNRPARIRMYGSAWLISTILGATLMSTGTSVGEAVDASSLLMLAILVLWIVIYCAVPIAAPYRKSIFTPVSIGRRAILVAWFVAFAVVTGVSTGKMQAAIVRRKLREYAKEIPESDLESLTNTLDFTRKNGIRIEPAAVAAIGLNLRRLSVNDTSTDATVGVLRAAQSAANLQSKLLARPTRANLQHYVRMPTYSVFDRSYVHDISFDLDTLAFMDSDVEDCVITYQGGPVFLKNTGFIRCEFNFSEAPEARELLLLFTQRNDPVFSYRADEIFRGFPGRIP
jgi:hypothetical protein